MAKGNWISQLKKLDDNWIVLVNSKKMEYLKSNLKILKFLANTQKLPGLVITLNRPFNAFNEMLKKEKIKTDDLFFVDCTKKINQGENERKNKVLYLSGPSKLSDISVAIDSGLNAIKKKDKFLFLDSLSTLLIYHASETVTQFIHFITSKLRKDSVKGIIIILESDLNNKIGNVVTQFSDLIVEV